MTQWPSTKAKRVLAALERIGWAVKRSSGSHRTLSRPGMPDFVFAFHDKEEWTENVGSNCEADGIEARGSVMPNKPLDQDLGDASRP